MTDLKKARFYYFAEIEVYNRKTKMEVALISFMKDWIGNLYTEETARHLARMLELCENDLHKKNRHWARREVELMNYGDDILIRIGNANFCRFVWVPRVIATSVDVVAATLDVTRRNDAKARIAGKLRNGRV